MAFSYNFGLISDLDKLRFLTSDVDGASPIYQDEELNGLLGMEPNLYMAASRAILARIPAFVTKAIQYQVGAGQRIALMIDRRTLIKNFLDLVNKYEAVAFSQVTETFDRLAFNIDAYGRDRSEYQGVTDIYGDLPYAPYGYDGINF